jgi:putative heme-binding domain-containing protein
LEQALRAYPEEVRRRADAMLAESRAEMAAQAAHLDTLAASLEGGNAEHGKEVFFGNKAACAACHRKDGQGGNIGPELSQIGRIRTRRDLLEAVVFPSASFARGFEPITIATAAGLTHHGVIGGETGTEITLRTGDRAEVRIRRSDIEEMQPAALSIMPQGLDKTLSQEELRDLLAFLAATP